MTEIQIASIDEELKRQWETQEAEKQIRASLFNLIIYTHEESRIAYFHSIVHAIIEKFPCRIIWIQGNSDPSQNYLKVSVSNVVTAKGPFAIACDQITIQVSRSQMERVPFIILPHFLSDLPIYLLWGAEESKMLPSLRRYADKLIFDSERIEEFPSFCRAVLKLMAEWRGDISDMNWAATAGWREALARTFDSQEKIFQLHDAKTVRIFYSKTKPEFEIQAMYLQAWLAGQMEWKLIQPLKYHNGAHDVTVELIPRDYPGAILGIEIQTNPDTLYALDCKEKLPQAVVHISTAQECALPFSLPLSNGKSSSTFFRNILYRREGSHYQKTLTILGSRV